MHICTYMTQYLYIYDSIWQRWRALWFCVSEVTAVVPWTSTEADQGMTLHSESFLVEIRELLGHYHFLCQSAPTNTSLLSSPMLAQELLFPQFFQDSVIDSVIAFHDCDSILLVDVEMLPACLKTAGNGEAFYGNADTTLSIA